MPTGRNIGILLLIVGVVLVMLTCVAFLQPQRAAVELRNAEGQTVGHADISQQTEGVRITVNVKGLTPGMHGIHIHAVSTCSPPNFTSAGGHYNPEGKKHGMNNPGGPHAGDMPNLVVGPDGTGALDYINPRVTLAPEATNSLFKVNGTSLVMHAKADDEVTDPSGNSGPRIACGPIVKAGPSLAYGLLPLLLAIAVTLLVIGSAALWSSRRKDTR